MTDWLSTLYGMGAWASAILMYLLHERLNKNKPLIAAFVGLIATFAGLSYDRLFLTVPGLVTLIIGVAVAFVGYLLRIRRESKARSISVPGGKHA